MFGSPNQPNQGYPQYKPPFFNYNYPNYPQNEPQYPQWLSHPGFYMPPYPMVYHSQGMPYMPPGMYPGNFHPQYMFPQHGMPEGLNPGKPMGQAAPGMQAYPPHQNQGFVTPCMPSHHRHSSAVSEVGTYFSNSKHALCLSDSPDDRPSSAPAQVESPPRPSKPLPALPPSSQREESHTQGIVTSPSPASSEHMQAEGAASELSFMSADGAASTVEHSETYLLGRSPEGGQVEAYCSDTRLSAPDARDSENSVRDSRSSFHRLAPSDGMETQL
jgi:hypothetical protein